MTEENLEIDSHRRRKRLNQRILTLERILWSLLAKLHLLLIILGLEKLKSFLMLLTPASNQIFPWLETVLFLEIALCVCQLSSYLRSNGSNEYL